MIQIIPSYIIKLITYFTGVHKMHTLEPSVQEGVSTNGAFTGVLQHFLYLGIVTYCTLYKRSPVQKIRRRKDKSFEN